MNKKDIVVFYTEFAFQEIYYFLFPTLKNRNIDLLIGVLTGVLVI